MKPAARPLAILAGAALLATTGLFARAAAQGPEDGFPDLAAGLAEVEGCLGVETARTQSGKSVIFAWFEDKEAAVRWYYSDMHQGAMRFFFGEGASDGEPMEDVPDEVGPVLAIASITMAKDGEGVGDQPFSQIAIELYTPITGGIAIGGKFAPKELVVPKRKVIVADEG